LITIREGTTEIPAIHAEKKGGKKLGGQMSPGGLNRQEKGKERVSLPETSYKGRKKKCKKVP